MLGAALLQQGISKEQLSCLATIECPFQAKNDNDKNWSNQKNKKPTH